MIANYINIGAIERCLVGIKAPRVLDDVSQHDPGSGDLFTFFFIECTVFKAYVGGHFGGHVCKETRVFAKGVPVEEAAHPK